MEYDDPGLRSRSYINGIPRAQAQKDGLGRVISQSMYPDPDDADIGYFRESRYAHDGQGMVSGETHLIIDREDSDKESPDERILSDGCFTHDVEGRVTSSVHNGYEYINARVQSALAAGKPAISVDTKKKELVGDFKNGGCEWLPKRQPATGQPS